MLAVLKANGRMATVMPHGVLFRGGEEREARRHFIERGWLEAAIGLPAGLFYGTGIPACLLVMNKKVCQRFPVKMIKLCILLFGNDGRNAPKRNGINP
jgi:type I restriction-modification system DNA methylase subunit